MRFTALLASMDGDHTNPYMNGHQTKSSLVVLFQEGASQEIVDEVALGLAEATREKVWLLKKGNPADSLSLMTVSGPLLVPCLPAPHSQSDMSTQGF